MVIHLTPELMSANRKITLLEKQLAAAEDFGARQESRAILAEGKVHRRDQTIQALRQQLAERGIR